MWLLFLKKSNFHMNMFLEHSLSLSQFIVSKYLLYIPEVDTALL